MSEPALVGETGTRRDRPFRPSLADRRWRYATFCAIYLYQGLVAGFSLTALANYYAGQGVSATEVGLHFALAGLPWTIQPILWGPLVDRAGPGRRRVWAVAAILGSHCALGGLLLVPDARSLGLVGLVLFLHSLFAALLDTACDRMIMDHVPIGELGRTSAGTRIGFVAGTSAGAAVFAWTLPAWGFADSVRLLTGLAVGATILPLLVRERPGDPLFPMTRRADMRSRRPRPFRRFLQRLLLGLRRPEALRLLLLCFGIDFVLALFEVRFAVDLVQGQGWDPVFLSRLQAGFALAAGTVGALAIGIWSDRAGPLPALNALFVASGLGFGLASVVVGAGGIGVAGPVVLGLTSVLPSLLIVALVPALMRATRDRPGAATQFEVYMATMNLGSVLGAAASGVSVCVMPLAVIGLLVALAFAAGAALARRPDLVFHDARARRRRIARPTQHEDTEIADLKDR